MIVGLFFNLVMAKKPLSWHKIKLCINQFWNKATFKINKTMQLDSKLKPTIDLDRCDYILVVLHQAFKRICGMF